MLVVAGPSGSGKSSVFSLQRLQGIDIFNVDDRCAELNGGRYQHIPETIRRQATQECEAFIQDHLETMRSFAVETTLRTDVAIRQAVSAKARGFETWMTYVATADAEINVERVRERGLRGGHSAPRERVVAIYHASLANLATALRTFDIARVWDNSADRRRPYLVVEIQQGALIHRVPQLPGWLSRAVAGTEIQVLLESAGS
jgi:predicted ABC-type ATPase